MKFAVFASSAALVASTVNAHGYMSVPKADFPNGIDTSYLKTIDADNHAVFKGNKWNDSPDNNVAMFTKVFKSQSTYKTLKDLIDSEKVDACGKNVLNAQAIDVSKENSVKWGNDQEQKGFITSHSGPCEVWIDNTKVAQADNCVKAYPTYPASIPVDYSACKGECTLTFYWLALHEPKWQIYKNCAKIKNGSGGGATAPTTAPTTPSKAPTTPTNPQPTNAPQPTSTPAPTKKNCSRRRALRQE
ncbi:hypothetical protein Poli38472_002982 [Pythium oligandrum]|uniref:Uncharacterized protein n=1 Tax=Pythium oligandrum TaxID=41045 RepID=A0A8K1C6R1_PYTOL|nr:hypothetical protein Poli38472_002982 [Pythium oligandrum]|eukprot:TMW57057.1 hypothetical protein Poli38472_002982 [Pythium oligandrum]